jgi:dimethylargininase
MTDAKTIAFTREVGPAIARCELTHLSRAPIDLQLARAQHAAFERVLASLGCDVRRLPPADDLPDAVFVQDTAIILDEVAILARPGAASRRPEVASVAEELASNRPLRWIEAPGTLDGGDIVRLGRDVFVGQTARTNADAVRQLQDWLQPLGYAVHAVRVTGCLHLQSAVTPIADRGLLVNRSWIDPTVFGDIEIIEVDPAEPYAANALRVKDTVVYPTGFPRTRARLVASELRVVDVDLSELAKAEAGVTCCCLLVPEAADG